MELLDYLKNRRSWKKYLSTPVEQDKIDKIIQAGLYAPTGMDAQSPIIIQISKKSTLAKLEGINAKIANMRHGTHPFYNAPVVLLVAAKKEYHTAIYDGTLAACYMLLEAYKIGLGGCWIHRAKEELKDPFCIKMFEELGLDANEYEGIANIIIGYPDNSFKPKEKVIKPKRVFKVE